jgi:hypothetical protein
VLDLINLLILQRNSSASKNVTLIIVDLEHATGGDRRS